MVEFGGDAESRERSRVKRGYFELDPPEGFAIRLAASCNVSQAAFADHLNPAKAAAQFSMCMYLAQQKPLPS